MYSYHEQKSIEEAITFLSDSLKSSKNSKPVLLHSIRMMSLLMSFHYNTSIIIGALLHDLLEDTNITYDKIKNKFGDEIADIVLALTMDEKIPDYTQKYISNFQKAASNHKALIIRCADLIDNAPFIPLAAPEVQQKVREKHLYFYNNFLNSLKDEPIWNIFANNLKKI